MSLWLVNTEPVLRLSMSERVWVGICPHITIRALRDRASDISAAVALDEATAMGTRSMHAQRGGAATALFGMALSGAGISAPPRLMTCVG